MRERVFNQITENPVQVDERQARCAARLQAWTNQRVVAKAITRTHHETETDSFLTFLDAQRALYAAQQPRATEILSR